MLQRNGEGALQPGNEYAQRRRPSRLRGLPVHSLRNEELWRRQDRLGEERTPGVRIDGSVTRTHGPGLKTGLQGGGCAGRGPTDEAGAARRSWSSPGLHSLIGWRDLLGGGAPPSDNKATRWGCVLRGSRAGVRGGPGGRLWAPPSFSGSWRGLRDPARGAGARRLGHAK
ncbi:hypothetical protein NDU88_001773 [Pleurodeles waltl]|uniref:Uncharacterized protein n=1 Tax=Pleurodeles waltl TaxID=8319 RepID=A0AAV7U7U0_PLEWA|nr:hypothetical protein NDU88_001773 [Pleurodeles waltl]